jgi:6-phosphogluconate dehydrogenase
MQLGMIGLGRMGANIVRRLMRDGHECVVYDVDSAAVAALEAEGAVGVSSLAELVEALAAPRTAWVMVPAAITGQIVDELARQMEAGDIVIDGGNSYYRTTSTARRRSPRAASSTSTSARAAASSASSAATA